MALGQCIDLFTLLFVCFFKHLSSFSSFVSAFVVVPQSNPLIISGGLGSDLILWNAITGTKLAKFDLAPHRPGGDAASSAAAATPASVEDAVTQGCYISNISLANTQDGEFTVAVSVYPSVNPSK